MYCAVSIKHFIFDHLLHMLVLNYCSIWAKKQGRSGAYLSFQSWEAEYDKSPGCYRASIETDNSCSHSLLWAYVPGENSRKKLEKHTGLREDVEGEGNSDPCGKWSIYSHSGGTPKLGAWRINKDPLQGKQGFKKHQRISLFKGIRQEKGTKNFHSIGYTVEPSGENMGRKTWMPPKTD